MSLYTDPTLVMDETTAETPLGWTPSVTARPAPVRRAGPAHHRPTRRGRWWALLATAPATACVAVLAWALPGALEVWADMRAAGLL